MNDQILPPLHHIRPAGASAKRPNRLIVLARFALALSMMLLSFAPTDAVQAAETVLMPFPEGQSVRIIQGYNGGTHQGRSGYGLDLVLAGGKTSGAEVLSPIAGPVTWAYAPGARNGCMAIALADGRYSVMLCHVIFHRAFRAGESIARGQSLGTVGPPGTVGNNGTPHVHLELHRGRMANSPVPYNPPEGLSLEGVNLPASGARNEHGSRPAIVSTNGPGGGAPAAAISPNDQVEEPPRASPTSRGTTTPPPPPPEPVAVPKVVADPPPPSTQVATVAVAARPPPSRAAVIQGTGSCLNVREQPSRESTAVRCLPDGTEVALTAAVPDGQEFRWREIEGGGWVVADFLKPTRAVVGGTESCLNVRAEPTIGTTPIGCLPDGTSVAIVEGPVTSDEVKWYRVKHPELLQRDGWVVSRYLD